MKKKLALMMALILVISMLPVTVAAGPVQFAMNAMVAALVDDVAANDDDDSDGNGNGGVTTVQAIRTVIGERLASSPAREESAARGLDMIAEASDDGDATFTVIMDLIEESLTDGAELADFWVTFMENLGDGNVAAMGVVTAAP